MAVSEPGRVLGLRTASGGAVVETRHRVHVAVVGPSGELLAAAGEPELKTPLRSCAKPFQALGLYASGAAERFALTPEELALACASHEASLRQVLLVSAWLERMGLTDDTLECGAHAPGDVEMQARLGREDEPPRPIHNNCSGKHTGMVATALALGAPTRDYLRAKHPVQALVRRHVALVAGLAEGDLAWAVDGCSAPTPILSLARLARMGAALAVPEALGGGDADPVLVRGLRELRGAMTQHADLVGGLGVLDTRIMRSLEGVVAKRGADGLYLLALERSALGPVGVALKVEDGSGDARTPAVVAVLEALGVLNPAALIALAPYRRLLRKNHRNLTVGHYEVELALHTPDGRPLPPPEVA